MLLRLLHSTVLLKAAIQISICISFQVYCTISFVRSSFSKRTSHHKMISSFRHRLKASHRTRKRAIT